MNKNDCLKIVKDKNLQLPITIQSKINYLLTNLLNLYIITAIQRGKNG